MTTLATLVRDDFTESLEHLKAYLGKLVESLPEAAAANDTTRIAAICASITDACGDVAAGNLFLAALAKTIGDEANPNPNALNLALSELVLKLMSNAAFVTGEAPSLQSTVWRATNIDALSRLALALQKVVQATMTKIQEGASLQDAFNHARTFALQNMELPGGAGPLSQEQVDALNRGETIKLANGATMCLQGSAVTVDGEPPVAATPDAVA